MKQMKTKLDPNGWTVHIDEDIRFLSDEQIKEVCRLTVSNMVVIFKNQKLTPEQELNFCRVIGKVQDVSGNDRTKHISLTNGILRVTGEKNDEGEPGLFGHTSALDWHANQTSNPDRMPLIWLYGVKGTVGSRTSWMNNILSYQELPEDLKAEVENIEVFCGYKVGTYSTSTFFVEHVNYDNPIKLVQTNKAGHKGLYFPFLQIFGFKGYEQDRFEATMKRLIDHCNQEKYIYHHDWQDNDIVISEQWLSIHKRWAFDKMEERVLHRIAFDYDKIY